MWKTTAIGTIDSIRSRQHLGYTFIVLFGVCVIMNPADRHLSKDPALAPIIQQLRLEDLKEPSDPFHSLLRSILSQQLSIHVADKIIERFEVLCNGSPDAQTILELSPERLKSVGLSRQKVSYVRNIAEHHEGQLRFWAEIHEHSAEEILTELSSIKGVGEWTVHMLLIFNFHNPDILPLGDLIIRNSMCRLYGVTGKGRSLRLRLEEIGLAWAPHRSRASRYLWKWRGNGYQP